MRIEEAKKYENTSSHICRECMNNFEYKLIIDDEEIWLCKNHLRDLNSLISQNIENVEEYSRYKIFNDRWKCHQGYYACSNTCKKEIE